MTGSRVTAPLFVALSICCAERPPDGVIESGSLVEGSSSRARHRRVAGYYAPEVSGVQLWYEHVGAPSRPSVVLLNGADSQAIYWPRDFVVELLDGGYSLVRYDARDAGLSEWLSFPPGFDADSWRPDKPPPYGLDAHVGDLWGLLDGLDIESAHLVGVSQGGLVAQLATISEPNRVLSLTLLSTTPSNPYDESLGAVDPELLAYLREQFPRVGRAAWLPSFLVRCRAIDLQTDLLAAISGVSASDRLALRNHVQRAYDRAGINGASSKGSQSLLRNPDSSSSQRSPYRP